MVVSDGHGVEGHEVSGFNKRTLSKDLSGSTFIKVNEKLISNESINCIFSGTICVSLIYTPIKFICPNISDSRAIIGKYKNNKRWISINLSRKKQILAKTQGLEMIPTLNITLFWTTSQSHA